MLKVRVVTKQVIATDICALELVSTDGGPLPAFTAGSHIDVHLPGGLVRQYSLCNSPAERNRYRVGVLRDPASRGGSNAVHALNEGDEIEISEPRNHFELAREQDHAVLVAGGIGVTPLLCMAERLLATNEQFAFHYCAKSLDRIAFKERLNTPEMASHVKLHVDDDQASHFDPTRALPDAAPGTHLYVCGPAGFIDWILQAANAKGWAEGNVHREYFTAAETTTQNVAFQIKLASSGQIVDVRADQSAAEALMEQDVFIPMSCEQGVCGTCVTRVLEGTPEHRDVYMTDAEHAANDQFTPCCSRAKSLLVLDL
jgi:vanillate O-demethylase ferredoxin subunit